MVVTVKRGARSNDHGEGGGGGEEGRLAGRIEELGTASVYLKFHLFSSAGMCSYRLPQLTEERLSKCIAWGRFGIKHDISRPK